MYVRWVAFNSMNITKYVRAGAAVFGNSTLNFEKYLTDDSEGAQQRWTQKLQSAFKVI